MSTITESVEVDVDVRSAYDQWTQFESFPHFMAGVEKVEQLDETHLHWVTSIGPVEREFDATITEQTPDQVIAWRSDSGPEHAGRITFEQAGAGRTKVTAEMSIDPEGFLEKAADTTGLVDKRVKGDLERFKEFIESRDGQETGAWRGNV